MAYFEVTYVTCSKRKLARGLEENLDKNFIVIHCTLQKQGITRISLAANSCFIPVRNALARILRLVNPSKPSEPRDQIERSTMQLPVVCPQCHNEFQLTDVMYSQILSRVRGELARPAAS